MGSPFSNQFTRQLEHDVLVIDGYVALDASSNVVGTLPSQAVPTSKVYTRLYGAQRSIGPGDSAVKTQPHLTTGVYQFTLDEPWLALLGVSITMAGDGYGSGDVLIPVVTANVTGLTSGLPGGDSNNLLGGNLPGTDPSQPITTVTVVFVNTSGTNTDPPVNTGFWIHLVLKRGGAVAGD